MTASSEYRGAQLSVENLMARARAATGLSEFGDPWFQQPLGHLVGLINRTGNLKSDNEWSVQTVVGYLIDRLRLEAYLKRHPKVRDEKLDVVGVIVCQPRGGSTLLHRLISSSPQLTAVTSWENRFPVPGDDEELGDHSKRIAQGQAAINAAYEAWPEMLAQHPMKAPDHDEEILFNDRTFLSIDYTHYFNVPEYDAWELTQDHTKAYEELTLWIQLLQYNSPKRRGKKWFLKSPHHLLGSGLVPVMKCFPDAKIVMTHRALENVIGSFCSMRTSMIRSCTDTFDPTTAGPHAVDIFHKGLKIYMEERQKNPARFIDVQYAKVVKDPIGEFRRILPLMGLTVRPEDEAAAADWMSRNGRDTHPRHSYDVEDYGVTRAQLNETFKFYNDVFLK